MAAAAAKPAPEDPRREGVFAQSVAARFALAWRGIDFVQLDTSDDDKAIELATILADDHRKNDGDIECRFPEPKNHSPKFDIFFRGKGLQFLARVWQRFLQIVEGEFSLAFGNGDVRHLALSRVLTHPDVKALTIRLPIALESRFAPVEWRLPIEVAYPSSTLELDGELSSSGSLRSDFRIREFSKDEPIAEIAIRSNPVSMAPGGAEPNWLTHRYRARLLILPDDPTVEPKELSEWLQDARSRFDAVSIALVSQENRANWVQKLRELQSLIKQNVRLSDAIGKAFDNGVILLTRDTEIKSRVSDLFVNSIENVFASYPDEPIAAPDSPSPIVLPDGTIPDSVRDYKIAIEYGPFELSSVMVSDMEEISETFRETVAGLEESKPGRDDRHIQRLKSDNDPGFVLHEATIESICVGPPADDVMSAEELFPDHLIPYHGKPRTLQVMMYEPHAMKKPIVKDMRLAPTGRSEAVQFDILPTQVGPFEARVAILYRGRVLQTALVSSEVYETESDRNASKNMTEISMESRPWPFLSSLDKRREFQMALIANKSFDGHKRLVNIDPTHAAATKLDDIEEAVAALNEILTRASYDPDAYSAGLDKPETLDLLIELARWGRLMFTRLSTIWEGDADNHLDPTDDRVGRIQLITMKPDEVVPLEFIYDRKAPDSDAALCPNALAALEKGKCPEDCRGRDDPRRVFCPFGFWALRKTIERHALPTVKREYRSMDLIVQAVPDYERGEINLSDPPLFGFSGRISQAEATETLAEAETVAGNKPRRAADWINWSEEVQTYQPSLLFAYPHNDGTGIGRFLEIQKDELETFDLESKYVIGPDKVSPLVVLLGCDTSSSAEAFTGHVSSFAQASAAITVATIATLHVDHAPKFGRIFLKKLYEQARQGPAFFGDALKSARREMLVQSLPAGLSIVAFGDADWKISAPDLPPKSSSPDPKPESGKNEMDGPTTLEMLPAIHGDALWLEYGPEKNRNKILIDGGPIGAWKALEARVNAMDRKRVFELLVLTHVDTDHAEGLIRLFAEKPVPVAFEDVWYNGWEHLQEETLGGRQGEFFSALLSVRRPGLPVNDAFKGGPVVIPKSGDLPEIKLPGGMRLTLLSPTRSKLNTLRKKWKTDLKGKIKPGDIESALESLAKAKKYLPDSKLVLGPGDKARDLYKKLFRADPSAANGSSIAFLAEYGDATILLLGDAHSSVIETSIARLLKQRKRKRLKVDCVKLAHHGSKKNLRPQLLDLIDAKHFCISTNGGTYKHPSPSAIDLIIDHKMPRRPVLWFNYLSGTTKRWSDKEDQRKRKYTAHFRGKDDLSIKLELD